MRHSETLLDRGLGGADIQAAIDLHGIHRNDLPAKLPGQAQRDGGLANRRWTGQKHRVIDFRCEHVQPSLTRGRDNFKDETSEPAQRPPGSGW